MKRPPFPTAMREQAERRGQALVRIQVDLRPAGGDQDARLVDCDDGATFEFVGFADRIAVEWVRELVHIIAVWNARQRPDGRRRKRIA